MLKRWRTMENSGVSRFSKIFKREHDSMASSLFSSLSDDFEGGEKIKVGVYADYKRSVKYRGKYVEVFRDKLLVDNKKYEVSKKIISKIWNLLDKMHRESSVDKDLHKHFEVLNFKSFLVKEATEEDEMGTDDISPLENEVGDDSDKVIDESLDKIKLLLKEYFSKKPTMDSIFAKKDLTDDVLNKELESRIYSNKKDSKVHNPYLKSYESLCKIKRAVDKISMSIKTDQESKQDSNNQIKEMQRLVSDMEDADQIESIESSIGKTREYIKNLDSNISDNKAKLSLSDKNLQKKKKEFDDRMKIDMARVKNLAR